jgi:hypothetical protein
MKNLHEEEFEDLLASECLFHMFLLKNKNCSKLYEKFKRTIIVENKSLLSSRKYFRESSDTCSKEIAPAFVGKEDRLHRFAINFKFAEFCKDNWPGNAWPKDLDLAYRKIGKARKALILSYTSLAINRAKKFQNKYPNQSLVKLIRIAKKGLCDGIDKYIYEREFNKERFMATCEGRIIGSLIDVVSP